MDPSYLPQQVHSRVRALSGSEYYADAAGHLHDIDYRPFPRIQPPSGHSPDNNGHSIHTTMMGPGRNWNPRSPERSRTSPPYWETFTVPHVVQSIHGYPESSSWDPDTETSSTFEHPYNSSSHAFAAPTSQAYAYSYYDNRMDYSVDASRGEPVVQIDGRTGRRVLKKNKKHGEGMFVEGRDSVYSGREVASEDEDGDENQDVKGKGREKSEGKDRMSMSPKQKLHRTWVATTFNARLKVIRTQRWIRERLHSQDDDRV